MALRLCVLVALFWACVPAWPAEVATRDGLALRLEDAGGSVAGVAVAGRPLRLLDGATGGLSYRELRRNAPREPQVLARADFESETGPWVAAAGISRGAGQPVAAALRSDGGAEGSRRCMRLGEKQQYGHGVAFTQRVPVESGCAYEIAWHGRVPASSATYIVYVRVYDNKGRDITGATAAPAGWTYSPYSKTHCQYPIALGSAGAWERVARTYCTSEDAAALDVSLCLWRGDYADADLFTLARVGCAAWSKSAPLRGKAEAGRSAGVVRHAGKSPDGSLAFDATYTPAPDHIRCDVGLRDTGVPRQTRALRVCYTLPVDAAGWTWGDDALSSRRVEPGERLAGNTAVSGHSISPYPFSSLSGAGAALSGDGAGLSLATPMDAARLLSFSYGPDGYKVTVDLALSPETAKLGPGTGSFSFLLYGFDPEWGFRAAAEKYHRLMPAAFKGLPVPHGAWMWPVPPGEIHEPQDFGFAFLEYHSLPDAEIARCKALGIQAIHYIEPLGVRQWHPKARTREEVPSCEEALKELEAWAAETSDTRWAGVPRSEKARSILASLIRDASGKPLHAVDQYDTFAHWWFLNPDPDLPEPGHGRLCLRLEVEPVLATADGIYVDSVFLRQDENRRREHFAFADAPLAFSLEDGEPVLAGDFAMLEFFGALSVRLRRDGKSLMMNLAPDAYRVFAHLCDMLGGEVGGLRPDAEAMCQRLYAYHRPVSNLMQNMRSVHERGPELTHAEVEAFIKQQMFYGFFPGFSTIGGGTKPGYAGMKRYFRSPEQYERDRDLFRKYIPIIRRLSEAGWEPVTHARAGDPEVRVERFGSWEKGAVYFTLRNPSQSAKKAVVRIAAGKLGIPDKEAPLASDLVAGQAVTPRRTPGELEVEVPVAAGDTVVLSLAPAGTR